MVLVRRGEGRSATRSSWLKNAGGARARWGRRRVEVVSGVHGGDSKGTTRREEGSAVDLGRRGRQRRMVSRGGWGKGRPAGSRICTSDEAMQNQAEPPQYLENRQPSLLWLLRSIDLSLLEAETIALSILKQVMEEKETWRRNTTSVQVNVTFKCGIVGYCWRIASPVYAENIVNEEVDCLTSPFWFSYLKEVEGSKLMNKDGWTQSSQCDLEELSGLVPWIGLGNLNICVKLSSDLPYHLQYLRCADDKLKKMALRVIAESLSEEEIAGLKEAIPCDGHQQQRLVNDEVL
ncbi:hypothetical protein ZIOFF_009605 [Zingiber officinale]|uniref:Uncharacterized protein n=1 Tax=Zingiber officinale TaxID=94328 RepID=A0A8J5HU90_ZINOF|nr:hypothetical protein ZIOFF_009605 [Zingiber officinale]